MNQIPFILFLSCASAFGQTGKALFEANCVACHQVDTGLVGPSLIEVAKLYPKKNVANFLKWSKEPQRKRKGAIEMPSMRHIGDEGLTKIHTYILKLTKGKKEKKALKGDPFANAPQNKKFPRVTRLFMENSGPASIAVMLSPKLGLCWDAGSCRLRYASLSNLDPWGDWEKGGRGVGKFKTPPFYTETAPQLWSFASKKTPVKFHGYKLNNNLPTFFYSIDRTKITELFLPTTDGSLKREFSITGLTKPLTMDLSHSGNVQLKATSKKTGKDIPIENNKLSLTTAQATAFTLIITPRK